MKRFLAVALSVCLLMLCTVFIAPTVAQEPLPSAYVDVEGLVGYKAYVYQDFSDDNITLWQSDDYNIYSVENGQLAVSQASGQVWTQAKVEQAGHSIRDIESNAAQGYGFYIKQTASQWIRPLYYIADGNQVVTPPGETEYILVPADGSEPVTGTMRASGDFLISDAFEGYVLVKLPLSTLEGFSPYAMVGGNLKASQSAPIYAPRRTHGIPRSRDNPHHRKPAPQAGGALSHPSRLTWVATSPKNGLADCPVWERTSARYAFARRTPQRSRDEPFFRRRGRWKSLREKRTAPPFPHRMEICLALSAPLLQPVASTIQKNAHPNGCAFLHCLLASLYHWSIHSRKSACPVSLALSPARLVSSRRRRGSIAARANSQACPTNHLSSLSASTSGWNCNAST